VAAWAGARDDVVAAAVVGSWARGTARSSSDVDIVVLTSDKDRYVRDGAWVRHAVGQEAELVRTLEWGPVTERRVRLHSGLDVEFGFVDPSWASTDPVDPGTARVVLDGCQPLVDREGLLEALITAVSDERGGE
jgi:hypothetical protein